MIAEENHNHFSYLISLPFMGPLYRGDTLCKERSYEEWEIDSDKCITTFQG